MAGSELMNDKEIIAILSSAKTIAVVGLSRDPSKDSNIVAAYLKNNGYKIIPVNPFAEEILEEKCHKSLSQIPAALQKTIDVVDIFRPSQDVPPIVEEAVAMRKAFGKPWVVWMQLGIINEQAAENARSAGFVVIMDKCMKIEHGRLMKK